MRTPQSQSEAPRRTSPGGMVAPQERAGGMACEEGRVDWPALISKLLERLMVTQAELATNCRVAQQTISSWKKGARRPGPFAQRQLLRAAKQAGLEKWIGQLLPEATRNGGTAETVTSERLRELIQLLAGAPAEVLTDILAFARSRLSQTCGEPRERAPF